MLAFFLLLPPCGAVWLHRALGEPSSPSCPDPRAAGSCEQGPGLPGSTPGRSSALMPASSPWPQKSLPGKSRQPLLPPLRIANGGPQCREPQSWHHLPCPPTRGAAPAAASRGGNPAKGPWGGSASPQSRKAFLGPLRWRHVAPAATSQAQREARVSSSGGGDRIRFRCECRHCQIPGRVLVGCLQRGRGPHLLPPGKASRRALRA